MNNNKNDDEDNKQLTLFVCVGTIIIILTMITYVLLKVFK